MTNDTYQDALFFPTNWKNDTPARGFAVIDMLSDYLQKLTVAVTDLDGSKRDRQGPFTLEQFCFGASETKQGRSAPL